MKKLFGFSSFEFYFVMAVIALIVVMALQRYLQLAESTKRFSFEILSQHFATALNNVHTHWIIQHNQLTLQSPTPLGIGELFFNAQGWPIGKKLNNGSETLSLRGCYDLWMSLLLNPPALSYEGGGAYGSRSYHLSLSSPAVCRYEFVVGEKNTYYFEYSSLDGHIALHAPPLN